MTEYALLKNGVFVEFRQYETPPIVGSHKGFSLLPVARETIDNSTQKFRDKVTTAYVEPERYLIQTVYSDKPQPEIDALAEAEKTTVVNSMDVELSYSKALAQALFRVVNDVRELKGQQPITVDQFKTYLKGLL